MPSRIPDNDVDYELLREISQQKSTSQRALAQRMGMSVGKVNYCLKAIVEKGWVKANNFRRADNKWAYTYLLTPGGARAKVLLARAFLERKEREFEQLQNEIATLRSEVLRDRTENEQG